MTADAQKITLPNGVEIPVVQADPSHLDKTARTLHKVAAAMGKNAVRRAFRKGIPVTIGRDGKLIRLHPDGHEEVIGDMD